jgi:DNA-binding LacI/PurR family transcriptional regulator
LEVLLLLFIINVYYRLKKMKKVTIKDIAKESGFSICTVSHALNNTAPVNSITKEKIRKIAEKHDYRPSYMARAIKTRKSKYIALIMQNLSPSSKNVEMFNGVEKKLYEYGYCLNFFNTGSDPDRQKKIIQVVKDRVIDGVILQDSGFYTESMEKEVIEELDRTGIPLFVIEKKAFDNDVPFANINNFKGGQTAGEHLLGLGHSNIGILTLSRYFHVFEERVSGFSHFLRSNDLDPGFMLELQGITGDFSSVFEKLGDIYDLISKNKITAIFCTTDLLAPYLMKYLKTNGLGIPRDISIVGFDNDYMSELLEPGLTTINNDLGRLGEIAVDNIIAKIEKNRFLKSATVIDPNIIIRGSTASKG